MPDQFLAFDLGAESGRAVLGTLHGGALTTKEICRFRNEPVELGNSLHWDLPRLWFELRKGLHSLGNIELQSIGVDTWAVDYALLGEQGELLGNPYHYRDKRTDDVMAEVFAIVPAAEIYQATGIQFLPFNTLYQLFAAWKLSPRLLAAAERLLTIPDLLNFWLTGNAVCEFTNATTTQMVDARQKVWATSLMDRLSLPSHLPAPLIQPGSVIGSLLPSVAPGLTGTAVVAPACHDTASAVAAISARGETAFLSSGTWSLLGIETDAPIINEHARRANFTNEGGVCGTNRFLKNVMGLWMLQGCRRSFSQRGEEYTYETLTKAAEAAAPFQSLINPDDPRFMRPSCMASELDHYCKATGQPQPQSPGAYARAILESLAIRYRFVVDQLRTLVGTDIREIRVIGGGSSNHLLNQFTADATGCRVVAGPTEATALGNLAMQLLATGKVGTLAEAREIVARSHETRTYQPRDTALWDRQKERFRQYCEESFA